jgi:threonine dehydratase
MKIVVEPTGALAVAAVMKGRVEVRDRRVGIVISGGNLDLKAVATLFA